MYFFDFKCARKFITKKKGENNFSENCPTFNLGLKFGPQIVYKLLQFFYKRLICINNIGYFIMKRSSSTRGLKTVVSKL